MLNAITRIIQRCIERLPLDFRVLHRQFLLRVVDLEALSIDADVTSCLGQFAGILIMISICHGFGLVWLPPPPSEAWSYEQARLADLQFVIGLCAVLMWDTTFPDKRDALVLGPLPVLPRTILLAKIAASSSVLGLALVTLNWASSLGMSIVFGGSSNGMIRFLFAWWIALLTASAFIYGTVLAVQGLGALLLPRRLFLQVSAVLQLAAFAVFLAGRFLQPWLSSFSELTACANHSLLAWSPTFWFFALFNYLNGTLPVELQWVCNRASIALSLVLGLSLISLMLGYLKTMKKTAEQPDLVPGSSSISLFPRIGNSLQSVVALFCFRSIARSRQHRVALAFYWSIVLAIALSMARQAITNRPEPVSLGLIMPTIIMMAFAVVGLRGVFSLPISLKANWVLRITQLRPTKDYISATRLSLLLFGVAPTLLIAALLAMHFRPLEHALQHIVFLALFGFILVELSLVHFDKVPFTCSFVPGKTNVQVIFWGAAFVLFILGLLFGAYELRSLDDSRQYMILLGWCAALGIGLLVFNRIHA